MEKQFGTCKLSNPVFTTLHQPLPSIRAASYSQRQDADGWSKGPDHEVEMNAERICKASHSDPVVRATCLFLALLVASLLQGKNAEGVPLTGLLRELMEKVEEKLHDKNEKESFQAAFHIPDERYPHGCDVLTTLRLLVLAVSSEHLDFKKHITQIVMQGGEGACVHGGVVGGILGLILGYTNLPQDWLSQLAQENRKFMNTKLNLLLDLFGLP
ncbi:hypothetical protein GWK47_028350 [Chionoecetes opilio]|uniref:Uncharacterized protein n=1 Tax=Chionoecetes opilio TaxID=41210 RepID=A0A8J5D649_CHIOP|nr:hypothetical protein GWK47_028350 [Chionoecetes opilio]